MIPKRVWVLQVLYLANLAEQPSSANAAPLKAVCRRKTTVTRETGWQGGVEGSAAMLLPIFASLRGRLIPAL